MSASEAGPARRREWDRLDSALVALQACSSPESLLERTCDLALTVCGARAVAFGWAGGDGSWAVSRRADERAPGDDESSVTDAPVCCGERPAGVLRVVAPDVDPLIVDCFADGLAAMLELLALRQRSETQRRLLGHLRGTFGEPPDPPVTLIAELGSAGGAAPGRGPTQGADAIDDRLTGRQREVLDLMSAGLTNGEIGERLVIALPTVKSHVRAVLRAVGSANRADAIARYAGLRRRA